MPLAVNQLPEVGRQYAQLQQGIVLQGAILEALQPLYEQALLTESREADAVQVIDPAVAPARKAEPRRSMMVVAATLSALVTKISRGGRAARATRWPSECVFKTTRD